ncbi:MAG: hypothetical protein V3W14_12515 [Candidatus Neomarinimicrobiota bacterium]
MNNRHANRVKTSNELASLFQKTTPQGGQAHLKLNLPVAGQAALATLLSAGNGSLEDLKPRDGDLVAFPFRLLSAAYLGSGGYHLDFSRPGMLENALPLFLEPEAPGSRRDGPLVVVRDHSENIDDRLGLATGMQFSAADPDRGLADPGIDADLLINWKLAGDVVRRLLHKPPLVEACSVSLAFNWEKSHPQLEDWQFWMRLGEEIDGTPVRVVVTEIISVEHVGLVYAGADPAARRQGKPAEDLESPALGIGRAATVPEDATLTANLTAAAAAPAPNPQEDGVTLAADSPVWQLLQVTAPDRTQLESKTAELVVWADLGRMALEELRSEVRRLIIRIDGAYEQSYSQGLLEVVAEANAPTLKALRHEYQRRLETLVPLVCQECGSNKVSRQSSREGHPPVRQSNAESPDPRLYR